MNFLYDNFIAEGLAYVLRFAYNLFNDYAWAILVVTILIKVVMLPLDIKQRQSTAKMAGASAEVEEIKKRYASNQDLANKKVQEYYKKHNIKPTAGCLPMALTMIFLFAFYGALRNIVTEQTISLILRGAHDGAASVDLPGWLWINNIFQPDAGHVAIFPTAENFLTFIRQNAANVNPQMLEMLSNANIITYANGAMSVNAEVYNKLTADIIAANGLTGFNNGWFGLPIIAGGSLFLQQWLQKKLNPSTAAQPGGNMMLYFFPVFSAYICLSSNACFAMYWTISNIVSIVVFLVFEAVKKSKKKNEPVTIKSVRQ